MTGSSPRSSMSSSPVSQVLRDDRRSAETLRAQPVGHADERMDAFRQPGDGAVGLAHPHRGTVRPFRRDHQNGGFAMQRQPLVGAGRGVAEQVLPLGIAPARSGQQPVDRACALDLRRPCAIARQHCDAVVGARCGIEMQRDIEALGRNEESGPLRPFDEHEGVLRRLLPAELAPVRPARRCDRGRRERWGSADRHSSA